MTDEADRPPHTREPGQTGHGFLPGILKGLATPAKAVVTRSHTAEYPDVLPDLPPRSRGTVALLEKNCNSLDRFAIDFALCMYCGICVEVCPFDALYWSPEFEYTETDIREMTHERGRLGQRMATVPAPPALDPGSVPPAEPDAAERDAAEPEATQPEATDRDAADQPDRS